MIIDLVQLKTFVAVAEERNLTRAAGRLFISQSAASNHVRAVEDNLGTQLFVRTSRKLELTRAGELLLEKAKLLLNEEVQFASFARQLRGKLEGKVIVGSSCAPGTRIGELLTAMRAQHPLITVDLLAKPSSEVRQGLTNGELDVGILLGQPSIDLDVTHHELARREYCVAGPVGWKDQIESADWRELAKLPWITSSPGAAYSAMLTQLFGSRGLQWNTVIRFNNFTLGYSALQAGAGMMLVEKEYALKAEREGHLAISPIARADIPLCIAFQASRKDDPLIEAMLNASRLVWSNAPC